MDAINLKDSVGYNPSIKYFIVGIRIILGFVMILMLRTIYKMELFRVRFLPLFMFLHEGYSGIILSIFLSLVDFFIYIYPIIYLISIVLSRKYFRIGRIRLSILCALSPLINVFMVSIIILSPLKVNYSFSIYRPIDLVKFFIA
jgi:hypothetical protein